MRKKGFTISEVLITLGIIGTVIAIITPSLLKNAQEIENYAKLRKEYAEIEKASELIIKNAGGQLHRGYWKTSADVLNAYLKYLPYLKKCIPSQGCWNTTPAGAYTFDAGVEVGFVFKGNAAAMLKNGSYFYTYVGCELICNGPGGGLSECARLFLDVNANKGPNRLGKDIFEINLYPKKLGIGSAYHDVEETSYGGLGWGMTGYCLMNKCPQ